VRQVTAVGQRQPQQRLARRQQRVVDRRVGLRVGTPALATRGLQVDDFREVGQIMATALTPDYAGRKAELAERVQAIVERYPLYEHLSTGAAV
jgi:glycine/serine hydroxymethyltransferase